jgi:hypothetical protein
VQILRGERVAQQHMGAGHTRIEMADSWRRLRCGFKSLEEIVEILLLFLQRQVLSIVSTNSGRRISATGTAVNGRASS